MLTAEQIATVQETLFTHDDSFIYAIVDGASCVDLRFKIYEWRPQSSCLWSGQLAPDVEEVAPYMILLEKDSDFTTWLIKHGWQNHWNIFVKSALEPKAFRKQIRKLQLVRSPEGKTLFFRFYDPRVMENFLPTVDEAQHSELYENIQAFYFPLLNSNELVKATLDKSKSNIVFENFSINKQAQSSYQTLA